MKKVFSLFLCLSFCISSAFAAFTVSGGESTPYTITPATSTGIGSVYLFYGFTGAQVTYSDFSNKDFVWKSFTTDVSTATVVFTEIPSVSSTTLSTADIQDATGYILNINGVDTYYFWVFNYANYLPTINSLSMASEDCFSTDFTADITILPMEYYTVAGLKKTVESDFYVVYNTLEWNDESAVFETVEKSETIVQNTSTNNLVISLDDLYQNTKITLSGDKYAKYFNHEVKLDYSYNAIKPIVHAEGILAPRGAKNERDRGSETERRSLEGSAPMEVNLVASANSPLASDFTWYIYPELTPEAYGYYREQSFNYKFSDFGKYIARVETTTDGGCVAKDSIEINVLGSELEVPNVFTPNGDGANDEFCVAFKSLEKFNMWVYNRWGREVFSSSNASLCWDGYIGNAKASTGAYFYVIEATGADGKKYKKSGDINLLRGKE